MQIVFGVHFSLEDRKVTFSREVHIFTQLRNVCGKWPVLMVSKESLGQSQSLFLSLSPLDRFNPAALRCDVS